jgi:hypothetical protein
MYLLEKYIAEMTKASEEALKLSLSETCHRQLPRLATLGVPLCSLECLMPKQSRNKVILGLEPREGN